MQTGKIQKTSRAALWVARALQVLLAVGFCWSVVNWVSHSGQMDEATLLMGIINMAKLVGMFILFFPLAKLLRGLKTERTPFTVQNARQLKHMALILAVLGAMQLAGDAFISLRSWVVGEVDGIVVVATYTIFDISTILILGLAVVLFGVALVFEYGAVLQQQSDETL